MLSRATADQEEQGGLRTSLEQGEPQAVLYRRETEQSDDNVYQAAAERLWRTAPPVQYR